MVPTFVAVVCALSCAAPGPVPVPAQAAADSGHLVVRLGTDTLAVERYVRSPDRLVAEAVVRSPRTAVQRLEVVWGADGELRRVEVTARPADARADGAPTARTVVTVEGDSASVITERDGTSRTRRVAARPDAVPRIGPFYAPLELVLRRARGADRAVVPVLEADRLDSLEVLRAGTDSMVIGDPVRGSLHARVDAAGRLLHLNVGGTPYSTTVDRVPPFDLAALARDFAARDARGEGLGVLSPRDTAQATVAGARLLIDYSRPAKRGRRVFGGLVPYGQVWRAGANQATHLVTERDLAIGGVRIPAGTYTIFAIPEPDRWTLIVNRQTGQWGTQYDATQDLARIPMNVQTLPEPVERFTIAIRPEGKVGILEFAWDRTRAWVPFQVR